MQINPDNVTEKFKLYTGEPLDGAEPARDALCRELCAECTAHVKSRIKPEIQLSDEYDGAGALESLAAAEAFFQLAALDNAAVPQSVASSEIKIQMADRAGSAERLKKEKESACRGLLIEEGFCFCTA